MEILEPETPLTMSGCVWPTVRNVKLTEPKESADSAFINTCACADYRWRCAADAGAFASATDCGKCADKTRNRARPFLRTSQAVAYATVEAHASMYQNMVGNAH